MMEMKRIELYRTVWLIAREYIRLATSKNKKVNMGILAMCMSIREHERRSTDKAQVRAKR
jgi:hypothetical protein